MSANEIFFPHERNDHNSAAIVCELQTVTNTVLRVNRAQWSN